MAGKSSGVASRISRFGVEVMTGQLFWGYASILYDFLLIFIIPLAFAIRELVLLRREDRTQPPDEPA